MLAGRRKGPLLSPLLGRCDLTVVPVGDSRKFKAQHIWSERSDHEKVGQNPAALQPWLEVSELPLLDSGTLPKTPPWALTGSEVPREVTLPGPRNRQFSSPRCVQPCNNFPVRAPSV